MNPRKIGARVEGRPSLGITKKVSLTLTEEEWGTIEASGQTVAAFIKERMHKVPVNEQPQTQPVTTESQQVAGAIYLDQAEFPRRYAEERWDIYLRNVEEQPPAGVIAVAKQASLPLLPYGCRISKCADSYAVRMPIHW